MSPIAATRPLLACCGHRSMQAPEKVRPPCCHVPQEECTAAVASHPSAWAVLSGKEGALPYPQAYLGLPCDLAVLLACRADSG